MFGLGTGELLLVGGLAILLFGGKKLPQLGGALAKSIKNFKSGMKDDPEQKNNIENKKQS